MDINDSTIIIFVSPATFFLLLSIVQVYLISRFIEEEIKLMVLVLLLETNFFSSWLNCMSQHCFIFGFVVEHFKK